MENKNNGPVNNVNNYGGNNTITFNNGPVHGQQPGQEPTSNSAAGKTAMFELIGKNDLKTALLSILDQSNDQVVKNMCHQLLGRYAEFEFKKMGATLSAEHENLEMNQIRMATIELINKL